MKKVEFIQFEENSNSLKITEENFINLIESSGLISIIKEYQIPEEFLIKHREILDKNIIIDNLHLSEDFIKSALTLEYFENEDIKNLNMNTYSTLSDEFIKKFNDYINWERMILYLSSSDKIENIERFTNVIEKFNLWTIISANQLPIEFIRKYSDKLDWRILSIVNEFTEEELEEFKQLIPEKKEFVETDYPFTIQVRDIEKIIRYAGTEQSSSEISEKIEEEDLRFDVKHRIEKLTREDLIKMKAYMDSVNNN